MEYPLTKAIKNKVRIVKLNDAENQAIQDKADMYTRGNWSQWVRKAAISYDPAKDSEDEPRDPK